MKAKLGGAAAVTAVAHKLARIFSALVKTKRPHDTAPHDSTSQLNRQRSIARLTNKAKLLGYELIPQTPNAGLFLESEGRAREIANAAPRADRR